MADDIKITPTTLLQAKDAVRLQPGNLNSSAIGKMLFFRYDPKLKKILPYYDIWPLIFPLEIKSNYMTGLNFHYLPLYARAELIQSFNKYLLNVKKTGLKITYKIVSSNPIKFKYTKSMIKKYLFDHIQGQIVIVPHDKWNLTLAAPLDDFKKADNSQVWQDTLAAESHKKGNAGKYKR